MADSAKDKTEDEIEKEEPVETMGPEESAKNGTTDVQGESNDKQKDSKIKPSISQSLIKTHEGDWFSESGKSSKSSFSQTSSLSRKELKKTTIITFSDVTYTVINTKTKEPLNLLTNVNGYFEPGSLTALMGPSGAGKTTLLDVISGRKTIGKITGELLFNGKPPTRILLKQRTAYVEQFDTLIAQLTVAEMIMYQAELKLPMTEAPKQKQEKVDELINALGLQSCRDTPIGDALHRGISGGQAKRTNIGIALITDPDILFLDEPTSGLDSATSNDIMIMVRSIADTGRTVCATIHSPTSEAFRYFQYLLLLVKGHVVFFGNLYGEKGSVHYFEQLGYPYDPEENLADYLVEITGGGVKGPSVDFAAEYERSELLKMNMARLRQLEDAAKNRKDFDEVDTTREYATSFLYTLRTMFLFRGRADLKNTDFVAARVADKLLTGFVIATLYGGLGNNASSEAGIQNISAALFIITALPAFAAAGYMPSVLLERPLFYREQNDGCYRVINYLAFKILEEQAIAVVVSLIFAIAVFFSVQFQGSFANFWLIYHFTLSTGIAMAYSVASVSPNVEAANTIYPAINVMGLFFIGLLIVETELPDGWAWFRFLVFNRYSFHGLMNNQFRNTTPKNPGFGPDNEDVLDYYSIDLTEWSNFGILTAWFALYFVLAYLGFKNIRHVKR